MGKKCGKSSAWYILQTQLPLHTMKQEQGGSPQHWYQQHNMETVEWPSTKDPINLLGTHIMEQSMDIKASHRN